MYVDGQDRATKGERGNNADEDYEQDENVDDDDDDDDVSDGR